MPKQIGSVIDYSIVDLCHRFLTKSVNGSTFLFPLTLSLVSVASSSNYTTNQLKKLNIF